MSAELLRLDGVGVRLGGRDVLRDVSLTVHPGEFTGLIGPNGAGKTTLLRIILGLQPVTTGSVLIDGAPRPPRDASIGYVPQKLGISRTRRCGSGTWSRSGSTGTGSASGCRPGPAASWLTTC